MTDRRDLPLHALPGVRAAVRLRGRPRKVATRAPEGDARGYLSAAAARREAAIAADPLVEACDAHADSVDGVIAGIARETAALRWERTRLQDRGSETAAQVSSRIVDALGKLASLVVGRHEARRGEPTPAQLAAVRELFLDALEETAASSLGDDLAADLMARVRVRLDQAPEDPRVTHRGTSGR